MNGPAPPFIGGGYSSALGWYVSLGKPPAEIRVPIKVVAKPFKIAGRTMAANPLYVAGAAIVGLIGALVKERGDKNNAQRDMRVAMAQANDLQEQIDRGYAPILDITADQIAQIRMQFGIQQHDRNIAVCGRVSSGKSTFVNAIRGLPYAHLDSAPIGNEETTVQMTPYRDPGVDHLVWWDLPGAGGHNNREWDYFSQQNLFAFDQIIILHDQIFSQTECNIYRACLENEKEVLLVRTQSDANILRIQNDGLSVNQAVDRFVLDSIQATEDFLDTQGLPRPQTMYHVTDRTLRRQRNADIGPGLIDIPIDERRLLEDFGIALT